ncbi:MAG: TadE family protein [Collimonas sp.]|uniref:TadE/TadG family type IV pilus assembly protein n=1 Tax=Collimonas sp. TaxID=1963772 RepID=UPI0032664C7D
MLNNVGRNSKLGRGASLAEFVVAIPVVLIFALLCLQMVLMYRAKLAHNYAVQEAVRIGAMSNGRVVPRFVTDPLTAQLGNLGYAAVGKVIHSKDASGKDVTSITTTPGNELAGAGQAQATSDGVPVNNDTGSSSGNGGEAESRAGPISGFLGKAKKNITPAVWSFVQGLMRYGDSSVLQGYINGITPMYMGSDTGKGAVVEAQVAAYKDAMFNSCILYHNPTQAAFLESGVIELQGLDYGILKLPADYMRFRTPLGMVAADGGDNLSDSKLKGDITNKSIQENTILSIEIWWSYPLKVPIANSIIIGLTRLLGPGSDSSGISSAFQSKALDRGRYPFTSSASYRAQNALHWSPFYPLGSKSPPIGGSGGYQAFDVVRLIWNSIVSRLEGNFDPAEPQIGFCLGAMDMGAWAEGDKNVVSPHWWGESYDNAH